MPSFIKSRLSLKSSNMQISNKRRKIYRRIVFKIITPLGTIEIDLARFLRNCSSLFILTSLSLLLASAYTLARNSKIFASSLAEYALYCLIIGIMLHLIIINTKGIQQHDKYIRLHPKKSSEGDKYGRMALCYNNST